MCIVPGSRLFVRRDRERTIQNILPDVDKTKVSPAMHMNFNGACAWTDSGFLSLFEYVPTDATCLDGRNIVQSAYAAIRNLFGDFVHFFFIPPTVQQVELNNETVYQMPGTGRTPTLLETTNCNCPSKITEDGEVIEWANRYICEFLYCGQWVEGLKVVTERANSSVLLELMGRRTALDDICRLTDRDWPCSRDPGPGSSGSSPGVAGMVS